MSSNAGKPSSLEENNLLRCSVLSFGVYLIGTSKVICLRGQTISSQGCVASVGNTPQSCYSGFFGATKSQE